MNDALRPARSKSANGAKSKSEVEVIDDHKAILYQLYGERPLENDFVHRNHSNARWRDAGRSQSVGR